MPRLSAILAAAVGLGMANAPLPAAIVCQLIPPHQPLSYAEGADGDIMPGQPWTSIWCWSE